MWRCNYKTFMPADIKQAAFDLGPHLFEQKDIFALSFAS